MGYPSRLGEGEGSEACWIAMRVRQNKATAKVKSKDLDSIRTYLARIWLY